VTGTTAQWHGRVVAADGTPVPLAAVVIVRGTVPMPEIALLADSGGRFALRLPPGVFTLRAHGPDASGEASIDARTPGSEIVIMLGESATTSDREQT
jgi:hypothetical protein